MQQTQQGVRRKEATETSQKQQHKACSENSVDVVQEMELKSITIQMC